MSASLRCGAVFNHKQAVKLGGNRSFLSLSLSGFDARSLSTQMWFVNSASVSLVFLHVSMETSDFVLIFLILATKRDV